MRDLQCETSSGDLEVYFGTSPARLFWHCLTPPLWSFHWVSNYQWWAMSAVSCYTVSFNVRGL